MNVKFIAEIKRFCNNRKMILL